MKIKSAKEQRMDWVFIIICVLLSLICILPMLNLLAKSLSDSTHLVRNDVFLIPKGLNFNAYMRVFKESKYVWSFVWTVILTFICTIVSLCMTTLCAYPMIFDKLKGRSVINVYITITMFFNAGIIPNYLLIRSLGMLDSPLVLIIPSCLSVYNMIIMRSFFYGIPESLRESAEIDGADFFQILIMIYVPLSKPVMATLALFYAVGRWNGYSDALMYMKKEVFYPLQLYLYNIINSSSKMEAALDEGFSTPGLEAATKCAVVMFSTIPILMVYPWLQRFFIQGVTLGAVKE